MKKENRGGKREGAGRPAGEPTKTISFRVKEIWAPAIKKVVRAEIKRLNSSL